MEFVLEYKVSRWWKYKNNSCKRFQGVYLIVILEFLKIVLIFFIQYFENGKLIFLGIKNYYFNKC